MTTPPRTPRAADPGRDDAERRGDGASFEGAAARAPRPLNSAGRPVDSSGRPLGSQGRRERQPRAEREPRAGGAPRAAWEEASGDWERIRRPGGRSEPPPDRDPPGLASLVMLLEAARAIVPRELERQFTALTRELLLTLRAVIDWYLERLDGGQRQQRVEDIPIE